MTIRILLIEEDDYWRIRLLDCLTHRGHRVTACGSISEAADILQHASSDVLALDTIVMNAHLLNEGGTSVYASVVGRFPVIRLILVPHDRGIHWLVGRLENPDDPGDCTTV